MPGYFISTEGTDHSLVEHKIQLGEVRTFNLMTVTQGAKPTFCDQFKQLLKNQFPDGIPAWKPAQCIENAQNTLDALKQINDVTAIGHAILISGLSLSPADRLPIFGTINSEGSDIHAIPCFHVTTQTQEQQIAFFYFVEGRDNSIFCADSEQLLCKLLLAYYMPLCLVDIGTDVFPNYVESSEIIDSAHNTKTLDQKTKLLFTANDDNAKNELLEAERLAKCISDITDKLAASVKPEKTGYEDLLDWQLLLHFSTANLNSLKKEIMKRALPNHTDTSRHYLVYNLVGKISDVELKKQILQEFNNKLDGLKKTSGEASPPASFGLN